MKFRTLLILFLIQLFSGIRVQAQENWSLNDCINYALKNNLQLRDAGMNSALAELNYNQSKWNLLPAVGAGSDAGKNFGRSVDPATNNYVNTAFFNNTYYLGASVDLFRGFISQNQIRYNKFKKEASENYKLNVADEVAFSVMNAFFNVIYYEELLKIANDQKALSELNVRKIQILISTGLKSQTDLLEVKANFEKEALFCIQTANNIATSRIGLMKAMNLPPDQQITLLIPEIIADSAAVAIDIHELYIQHTSWSPYIRSFEKEWMASQKNVSISQGGFSPSISFQATYNTGFYETNKDANNQVIGFSDQININRRQFVGATLSIPLFNKNSVRFGVQSAKIQSEQALTRLNQAKQTLLYDMENNYNELNASEKEMQQAEKQMDADQRAFQASQKKFDQGMINAIDLYTTKNRLANSSAQVLHAKLMFEVKKRILEFYKGNRFWESADLGHGA
jgi:outer membrane protein